MAEERFPCRRPPSMLATRSDKVMLRAEAISLRPFQNASSRLTLVLCPAMTIEGLTTGDFIDRPPFRGGAPRVRGGASLLVRPPRIRVPVPPRAVRLGVGSRVPARDSPAAAERQGDTGIAPRMASLVAALHA